MALHDCGNQRCNVKASGRNIFCSGCWFRIPADLQKIIRSDTDKGEHSLRAHPNRDWMSRALRYMTS